MTDLKFNNVKTEVAIEIISLYIGLKLENDKKLVQKLIEERDRIYLGDKGLVDKVLSEYGKKIKELLN